ncbi:inositol oxygenase-like isoform X2 [Varroa jacobsoni]|nr:inositol oxygenase-like isoform X2 [Varroa destructor]XP_022693666.1 inositol oxygenase-like isoform X2 [Varroa jacobsoni]XP_022693667.1 inositol oxygenase-like isoform X2 [Varroa jacobsoni]
MGFPQAMEQPQLLYHIDPSLQYRPDVNPNQYRKYTINTEDPVQKRVFETYLKMHTYQTVDFVMKKREEYGRFDKIRMPVMKALEKLNDLIDESDPDVDMPNIVHAFQTAEEIRAKHPEQDWFHLTGLIHDLGKVMAFFDEPQWAVVGDTFPVGCQFAKSIVYRDFTFILNPDSENEKYNTPLGMYQRNCGLENVLMSWGHDEYMHMVLRNHPRCTLPEEAFYVIRFHSFYPCHTSGDYDYLLTDKDREMLKWVREFNRFDLYTKTDNVPNIDELMPYYQGLIDKYIPGEVAF